MDNLVGQGAIYKAGTGGYELLFNSPSETALPIGVIKSGMPLGIIWEQTTGSDNNTYLAFEDDLGTTYWFLYDGTNITLTSGDPGNQIITDPGIVSAMAAGQIPPQTIPIVNITASKNNTTEYIIAGLLGILIIGALAGTSKKRKK